MELIICYTNIDCNFEGYLNSHKDSTIWHNPSWFAFRLRTRRIEKYASFYVKKDEKIIAGGIIQINRKIKFFKTGYIQGGLLFDNQSEELRLILISAIDNIAKTCGLIYIDIDFTSMNDFFSVDEIKKISNNKIIDIKPIIPQFTTTLNLDLSEEDLLLAMKSKGRYNIKLAAKKDVVITQSRSKDDIKIFYSLLTETTTRDGFRPNELQYYLDFVSINENSLLLLAKHEDDVIAGGIFTYTGSQALYYYGASSNNKRNLMAPYLLQWEAIKLGKEKGCLYYDFLGVAEPGKDNDPLIGVTDFKLKFGGDIITFNKPMRIIYKNKLNNLFSFIKRLSGR